MTLEPDVAALVEQEMGRSGKGLQQVVNEALRAGFATARKPAKAGRFVVDARPMGLQGGYDHDRLQQIADQLEVEEVAQKLAR